MISLIFCLKTLQDRSGRSYALCPDSNFSVTSGQLALNVTVMNGCGLPRLLMILNASSVPLLRLAGEPGWLAGRGLPGCSLGSEPLIDLSDARRC